MSELEQNFKNAAEMVKGLTEKPDNNKLLELYSLYKQATVGNVNTAQPWAVQLEARAKWDAWKSFLDHLRTSFECNTEHENLFFLMKESY